MDSIVVTAADEKFFALVREMLESMEAKASGLVDIGFFDLGISSEQRAWLEQRGVKIVEPQHFLTFASEGAPRHVLNFLARAFLPENFPGYKVYIWVDADTWFQSAEPLIDLDKGAGEGMAAMVREQHPAYREQLRLLLWKAKHYVLGFGVIDGLRLLLKPQINAGIFALNATAPHWRSWRRRYQSAIDRTGKATPHDQFALNAAVYLDRLDTRFLPASRNWICDLATPGWSDNLQAYCEPGDANALIGIIHLAGPVKERVFDAKIPGTTSFMRGKIRYNADKTRLAESA